MGVYDLSLTSYHLSPGSLGANLNGSWLGRSLPYVSSSYDRPGSEVNGNGETDKPEEEIVLKSDAECMAEARQWMFLVHPGGAVLELPYSHGINIDEFNIGFYFLGRNGATDWQLKDYSLAAYFLFINNQPLDELNNYCQELIGRNLSDGQFALRVFIHTHGVLEELGIDTNEYAHLAESFRRQHIVDKVNREVEEEEEGRINDEQGSDSYQELKDQIADGLLKQILTAGLRLLFG